MVPANMEELWDVHGAHWFLVSLRRVFQARLGRMARLGSDWVRLLPPEWMIHQLRLKPPFAKVSLAQGLPIYEYLSLGVLVFVTIKKWACSPKVTWAEREG